MNARNTLDSEARGALRAAGWTILHEASDGVRAWRGGERIRLAYTTAGRTHIYSQDLDHVLSMGSANAGSRKGAQGMQGGGQ